MSSTNTSINVHDIKSMSLDIDEKSHGTTEWVTLTFSQKNESEFSITFFNTQWSAVRSMLHMAEDEMLLRFEDATNE